MEYFPTASSSSGQRPQTMVGASSTTVSSTINSRIFSKRTTQTTIDARPAPSMSPHSVGFGTMAINSSLIGAVGHPGHLGPHRTATPITAMGSASNSLQELRRRRDYGVESLSPADPTTSASDQMDDSGHRPMSWTATDSGLSSGRTEAVVGPTAPQVSRSNLGSAQDSLSRILQRSLEHNAARNEVQTNPSMSREERSDNRMSWISDTSSVSNTVTTNTEPGWDFASSTHMYSSEPQFPMPDPYYPPPSDMPPHGSFPRYSQPFDSPFQHDPYLPASSNEPVAPEMPSPSPFPPGTSTASTTTNGQWWPTHWNFTDSRHTPRPPTPSFVSAPHDHWHNEESLNNFENPEPTPGIRSQSRLSTASDWDFFVAPARAMPQSSPTSQWPPYEVSSSSPETNDFPPASRLNPRIGTDLYAEPPFHTSSRSEHPAPPVSMGQYLADRYSRRSLNASTVPSLPPASSRVTVSVDSSSSSRNGRLQDGPASRQRRPSPPPPNTRPSTLQSLLDRHSRRLDSIRAGIPGLGMGHSRSVSDSSGMNVTQQRPPSPPEIPERPYRSPVERLSAWGHSIRPSHSTQRGLPPLPNQANMGSGTSNSSSSLYDHPSMRDLLDSHGHERILSSREREYPRYEPTTTTGRNQPLYSESYSSSRPGRNDHERQRILSAFRRYSPPLDSPPAATGTAWYPPPSPPPPRASNSSLSNSSLSGNATSWMPTPSRTRQRTRETPATRLGRLLSMEYPLAWLGPEDDPLFNALAIEPEPPVELVTPGRSFARARAQRRARIFGANRLRTMGDYVLDEDFDDSYEALTALGQMIGPAAKGCSEKTLDELQSGLYRELCTSKAKEPGKVASDNDNCAICLEDYKEEDVCVKLSRCSHLYHKECIKEWLKTAKTCPVCRETVEGAPRAEVVTNPRRPSLLSRAANLARSRDQTQARILDALASTPRPGPPSTSSRLDSRILGRRLMMNDEVPTTTERNTSRSSGDTDTLTTTTTTMTRNASTTRRERPRRRLRQIDTTISTLGEYDTPWPGHSPSSPTSLWYFEPPSSQMWASGLEPSLPLEEPRFVAGPLTRSLRRTGSISDIMRGS